MALNTLLLKTIKYFADFMNYHLPIFIDGWQSGSEFVAMLCESPFGLDSTWKLIWDQKVTFVVTLLTSVAKVKNAAPQ